jgi:hypothetical protein
LPRVCCSNASACRTAIRSPKRCTAIWSTLTGNRPAASGRKKSANDEQLKSAAAREQQQLKTWLAEREKSSLDKFGGWNKGLAFKASGFFRTEKRDGRWYLVTPEGHPFYSLGVNTISPQVNQTYVAGREYMFESLPKPEDPLAKHFGEGDNRGGNGVDQGRGYGNGRWYDFYGANLQRVYGEPCKPTVKPSPASLKRPSLKPLKRPP